MARHLARKNLGGEPLVTMHTKVRTKRRNKEEEEEEEEEVSRPRQNENSQKEEVAALSSGVKAF
ncbi:hypothetical protein K0M31_012980 [Melipona bicolor]|uniref:Uncharacterized protein n=1 Tax=Melipona bicolor TaxID=60889 RepID=A0AA40KGZ8_9HYME|nr:hypothetical protein K0M31_012980 [Melipona bicolor]